MRALVTHLVALAITLHTLLGCCWHHAHETVVAVAEVQAKTPTPIKRCGCHRHQAEELAKEDEHHSEKQEPVENRPTPCGEKCQYVAAGGVKLDAPTASVSFDLLPAVDQPVLTPVLTALLFESEDASVDPPPLRLHLLHQLLLI